ncbi:MAG: bifunctional folylpolyglutamate synthase/dihydrofolate synthase [Clostridioides sp.]|nr:bifunctional folylpolyglutamate synthase/dihydrofolate synthase [Clostridioides sp.]
MNYEEALEYISSTHRFGMKLGLDRIKRLLELLSNPQDNLKFIHIAGTNGKGSVASFIANILETGGYKTGLYTSPYLEDFTERIRINMINIPKSDVAKYIEIIKEKIEILMSEGFESPTEFEIETVLAFLYYKEEKVDYVVLEVGLGGRFDATNIISESLINVIVSISLDHTNILGDTISQIAYEKAGIIKENSTVVIYPQEEYAENIIEKVCKEKDATLIKCDLSSLEIKKSDLKSQIFSYNIDFDDINYKNICNSNLKEEVELKGKNIESTQDNELKESNEAKEIDKIEFEKKDNEKNLFEISMIGEHQIKNACLALKVVQTLVSQGKVNLYKKSILEGLKKSKWAGRIEIISENPKFIIDGAHNLDGARSLAKVLKENFGNKKQTLIIGMLADKDFEGVVEILSPYFKKIIITKPDSDRALAPEILKEKFQKYVNITKSEKNIANINNEEDSIGVNEKNNVIVKEIQEDSIDTNGEEIAKIEVIENIEESVEYALNTAKKEEIIVAAGSLYLIGKIRTKVKTRFMTN